MQVTDAVVTDPVAGPVVRTATGEGCGPGGQDAVDMCQASTRPMARKSVSSPSPMRFMP